MKISLRNKLSLAIVLVVLLTVSLISLLANFLIQNQFRQYISKQQQDTRQNIISTLSEQYDADSAAWNAEMLHAVGMTALSDGYIIKVFDNQNRVVWDAETCDMSRCVAIRQDASHHSAAKKTQTGFGFKAETYPIEKAGKMVGSLEIGYNGPDFLNEIDYQFISSLNKGLIILGVFSLFCSVIVGFFMAKRLSRPIRKTVDVAKRISDGDYSVKICESSGTMEVDELISSINNLARSIENQENLRKRLTQDVAHELRTPLTTVGAHLEAMIEGVWQPTPQRLLSCHEEITRIGKLVSDLESLAKVESDNLKLEKTQVNLRELADKAVCGFESEIAAKNLKVTVGGTCQSIMADENRIRQIMVNLISNAVKYTGNDGAIAITIAQMDKHASFCIKDNGIGISADELPHIFERFYRADKSRNRMTGGSGIGLAIVKSIVNAHGGNVDATSEFNYGSTFYVELPFIDE